ncbi:MAG: restriction endonuclease subunit S [Acidimicrobiia bacterium]|nr:MAG: restriction endonuclease subunit S [Acidimicrobiia bacterium]
MDTATFLDDFATIADAPGGIDRLRDLILDLAMRGELMPQSGEDAPASGLLDAIAEEFRKSTRRQKKLPGIESDEVPFAVPASWEWARLGMIASYNQRPKVDPSAIPGDAWLLDLQDIEKDTSRLLTRAKCSDRSPTSTKTRFEVGDVLFGKLRPYLNKVLVADAVGYSTSELVPITPGPGITPEWLRWSLKRPDIRRWIAGVSYGVKMPRLGTGDALASLHPVPPTAEQRRIVEKVNELMALCDDLEARQEARHQVTARLRASTLDALATATTDDELTTAWQRVHDNWETLGSSSEAVDGLRDVVLDLAVRGRLSTRGPVDTPVSEVLGSIAQAKQSMVAEGVLKKTTPPATNGYEPEYVVPDDWLWAPLHSISLIVTDGTHQTPTYVDRGVPFVSIKDISSGALDFSDTKFISEKESEAINRRCAPQQGDVLFCRIGTLGQAVVVDDDRPFSIFVSVGLIRPGPRIDPRYLRYALNSPTTYRQYDKIKAGGSHASKLNLNTMRSALIPVPPPEEQVRIVEAVDELMMLCDALEAALSDRDAAASSLADAACDPA